MSDTLLKKQGIYLDLDALLDTRLSILFTYGDEILQSILSDNYFIRNMDTFKGIDRNEFISKYNTRDKLTLKDTIVCKLINMVKELVDKMVQQALTSPFHTGPKIFLNIYPYKLLPEEEVIMIRGLIHVTNKLADIQLINLSPEELTPQFLKDNLAILFKYDYNTWLDMQLENFKLLPCPEISLFIPEIYPKELPTKENIELMAEKQMNSFKLLEFISAPLIGLKAQAIELFSANLK